MTSRSWLTDLISTRRKLCAEDQRESARTGTIETVTLDASDVVLPAALRVYLMVDAYPAAVQTLN